MWQFFIFDYILSYTLYNNKHFLFAGGKLAFALHVLFSLLNTMYIPYAIVYYIQRVYLMCQVNSACSSSNLTLANYMTAEIIVMLVGMLAHIPFWFFILKIADVKKSGGKIGDVFTAFQVSFMMMFVALFGFIKGIRLIDNA